MTELHHFYHIFADGVWGEPTKEHFKALLNHGLYENLTSLNIGFMGCLDNIMRVETYLKTLPIEYNVVSRSPDKWEQATLIPLWEWSKTHDGYVSYAHTKGAGFQKDISAPWRRSMTWYNICQWQTPVSLLDSGKKVVGCHFLPAAVSIGDPSWGWSGMFGGNFWWSKAELIRQNVCPTLRSRLDAEHWLMQMTEVMDVSAPYVADMNPQAIADFRSHVVPDWWLR